MVDEPQGGEPLLSPQPEITPTQWYGDEHKELVEKKGWDGADSFLKSYTAIEKMSSGMAKLPTPETSAEEIRAFYQKTGCPENPEGYEITGLPEDLPDFVRDEGTENAMKQVAYDQGVSKQAFEAIVRSFYEKADADLRASKTQGEQTLKEQHGDKYDEVITVANRFFDSCSEEFCTLVKATGLASHPVFINEFNNKGKATMSDTLIKGSGEGEEKDKPIIKYPNSPEMYASGEDDESKQGRAYHEAKGYKY